MTTTYQFTSLPNSGGSGSAQINNSGQVLLSNGKVYNSDGSLRININYPQSTATWTVAINDSGTVLGEYEANSNPVPFIESNGAYTALNIYTSTMNPDTLPVGLKGYSPFVYVTGITNLGEILGAFDTTAGRFGYISNGSTTTLLPGTVGYIIENSGNVHYPVGTAINNSGDVIGYYDTALPNGTYQKNAFLYSGGGYTTIAASSSVPGSTELLGINNVGQIIGSFKTASGAISYFLYRGGTLTPINDLGGKAGTVVNGINDLGQIVGEYTDASGVTHGFVYDSNTGKFTPVDDKAGAGTFLLGINNSGQLVGYYTSGNSWQDFIASPVPVASPVISSADKSESASLILVEDSTGNITTSPVTGVIHFTDSDASQNPAGSKGTQTATLTNADNSTVKLTQAQMSALENAFTVADEAGNTNNRATDWKYDPSGTALDFVGAGQTAVVTSTVQVADPNSGTSDTATVTVTVHGFDTDYWKANVGRGNWSVDADWTQGRPTPSANVVINTSSPSGNVTLDQNVASPTVRTVDIETKNTLTIASGQTLTIKSPDNNALEVYGNLTLDSGANVIVKGGVAGTGTITIGDGATLEVHGVGQNTEIAFASNSGILKLDPVTGVFSGTVTNAFWGIITNLSVGDTIDLVGVTNVYQAAIGLLNSKSTYQTLQIKEGDPNRVTGGYDQSTPPLNISISSAVSLTGDFFNVTKSGTDTLLTLQQGNPIDLALNAPAARKFYGVTGQGIKIGIISDSYNDLFFGPLPSYVTVLPNPIGKTLRPQDEGRAMADIIHAIAPGASIYFCPDVGLGLTSEQQRDADLASAIQILQNAGCDVIVDDIWDREELPGSQTERMIDNVVNDGAAYFTLAGNSPKQVPSIIGHSLDPNAIAPAPAPIGQYITPAESEPFSAQRPSFASTYFKPDISAPDRGPTSFSISMAANCCQTAHTLPLIHLPAPLPRRPRRRRLPRS